MMQRKQTHTAKHMAAHNQPNLNLVDKGRSKGGTTFRWELAGLRVNATGSAPVPTPSQLLGPNLGSPGDSQNSSWQGKNLWEYSCGSPYWKIRLFSETAWGSLRDPRQRQQAGPLHFTWGKFGFRSLVSPPFEWPRNTSDKHMVQNGQDTDTSHRQLHKANHRSWWPTNALVIIPKKWKEKCFHQFPMARGWVERKKKRQGLLGGGQGLT